MWSSKEILRVIHLIVLKEDDLRIKRAPFNQLAGMLLVFSLVLILFAQIVT